MQYQSKQTEKQTNEHRRYTEDQQQKEKREKGKMTMELRAMTNKETGAANND